MELSASDEIWLTASDLLEARSEAALVVIMVKSLTWPTYNAAVMKYGLERGAWLQRLTEVLAISI